MKLAQQFALDGGVERLAGWKPVQSERELEKGVRSESDGYSLRRVKGYIRQAIRERKGTFGSTLISGWRREMPKGPKRREVRESRRSSLAVAF